MKGCTRMFMRGWYWIGLLALTLATTPAAFGESWKPLAQSEMRGMSTEQVHDQFCFDQRLAEDLRIEVDKYGGFLLKEHPSPVYQKSYEEAKRSYQKVQEELRRITRILIDREEALPSCLRNDRP